MVPLVAIPSRYSDTAEGWRVPTFAAGRPYAEAILRAGGMPCVLVPDGASTDRLADVLGRFDAVCLLGGPDIDPDRYGATDRHEHLYGLRDDHDAFELELVRVALALDLPMLAICRGHQVLNVALGGTLHQHITDDDGRIGHRFEMHDVVIEPGSLTESLIGPRASGHSVHHQAIDRLGDGLVVTAHAPDGTIEGIELPGHWVVGVQWHPEDTADTDPVQQQLFDGLVAAAQARLLSLVVP